MECKECRHNKKGHNCFPAKKGKHCRGATEQLQAELDTVKSDLEEVINGVCVDVCLKLAPLRAENKQQADFLSLAKEQMDAYKAELEKLKEIIGECQTRRGYAESDECAEDFYQALQETDGKDK